MFLWLAMHGISPALAAYVDEDPSTDCAVRVHYPDTLSAHPEVIILGVGTSMTRHGYDRLAGDIIDKGYVFVSLDNAPGRLVKTSASAYRACALLVKSNLTQWLAPQGYLGAAHWILGGHSAGGQAAQEAIAADATLADAVFSLDPFNSSNVDGISVPALYWGFSLTTCFVTIDNAAKAAYYKTNAHRAFYRIQSVFSLNRCGWQPTYVHCSFCDNYCPFCSNCAAPPESLDMDVASTVQSFINAQFYGQWAKENLYVPLQTPTDLFVDSDTP